jgi:SAM-dependent methyltransferase
VLCVDGRPTVYVCGGDRFTSQQKWERQRFVWNQGLAPLLVFLTPNYVEVHSSVKKPERNPAGGELFESSLSSLIPNLRTIAETLESARFVRSIETGQFFQDNAGFFPPNESVDRCLVDNLVHAALRLKKDAGWSFSRSHALLGRALFISFLHERKFIKPHYYPHGKTTLLDILSHSPVEEIKRLLYREFFPRLQREFNGTMFDTDLADEERHVRKAHLDILRDFLTGHDMRSGQMTLGFWPYDFRFIPVETISAVYEEFMKDADLEKKRKDGAYYTPRHLAETTLHVALEDRYSSAEHWRVLDPACGSGIFLVAMFNLLAEQWRRRNASSRRQTKAQALLDILQKQLRGVDVNLDACRIAAFSLYLALFEKLQPIDVDEFKERTGHEQFLPPLLWRKQPVGAKPTAHVILHGDFLKEDLPLEDDFDLIIGNPPWDSRGDKQIALHFAKRSATFLRHGGIGCLLLPSTILVNRHGTLDGAWFRGQSVEKIVHLADFRFVLFKATHPCFILRYVKEIPTLEHTVVYETPKVNRFDRRQGVIVVEPDDQKLVAQHDVIEAALQNRLQALWSRKFWGSPRDEAFLRRMDFFPRLLDSAREKKWGGGVGFQPFYPGASPGNPKPLRPWKLSDSYLHNDDKFPRLVLHKEDFVTLREGLDSCVHQQKGIRAQLDGLRRKPADSVFTPPMVIFSKGFTKCAFYNDDGEVRFLDGLRSVTGPKKDADLLRFLAAVMGSRLFKYIAFHSGSNLGVGRDQMHVYESLALPFPLPNHELAPRNAEGIVREAAGILKELEKNKSLARREGTSERGIEKLERLVEAYFSVTDTERMLIEDTLTIYQPSIHSSNLDANIPSLAFPEAIDRKRYADTLCDVLNRHVRKQGIRIYAQGMASKTLNLIFFTLFFGGERKPYNESGADDEIWITLDGVAKAAERNGGSFSYLRGFSYFESDRLHMLKPATMRNCCRTAALNDADGIFEHLAGQNA